MPDQIVTPLPTSAESPLSTNREAYLTYLENAVVYLDGMLGKARDEIKDLRADLAASRGHLVIR